jgi:Kef-type K+ transport system membrane component KefB
MLAARWTGMGWKDSFSIGVLMNTRGLVELIVLNIGYDLGILSPRIFTMMVLMALVTTFMTGPILSLLGYGRRVPSP